MNAKDKRIAELEGIIKKLLEDNAQLKERIAILEKHSGNSSKPPSSDIVKPPKDKDRRRKRRKIGAQKGHKVMRTARNDTANGAKNYTPFFPFMV